MGEILQSLGQLLSPIGTLFHYLFYLPVFNILMGFYMMAHSFALAIVVLTLALRVALIPLTRAQLKSQQEMQKLAPELARIKREHPNDPQAQMAAQQQLYREHGVSPMKGCLPLLIQMPFLYALYYSFYAVLRPNLAQSQLPQACKHLVHAAAQACVINNDLYPFMPHLSAASLPSTQFFWTSLATPDQWHILPILAAALTFIQLRMAMPVKKPQPRGGPSDPTTQATSTMQFMMPFITLFIGWTFPAGLALYWCISTGFSAVQQYFINGNLGSLFVGVPGMEHLVPPPKDITTTNTPPLGPLGSRGPSAATVGANGRASTRPGTKPALPAPSPAPASGVGGFFQRLRDGMAAGPPTQALTQTNGAESEAASDDASASRQPRRTTGAGPSPRRLQRPTRERAMLVRGAGESPADADATGARPEDEVARAGRSTLNGRTVLPEQAIASEHVSNGTNGANGANGANDSSNGLGAPRANGAQRGSGAGQNGQYYRKGSSSGRKGGRPKGGR